jgi:hypothetical protein
VQVFAFEEEAESLKEEEGLGLKELEPEDLVPFFEFLFFLKLNVWRAESPCLLAKCRFTNLVLTSWNEESSLVQILSTLLGDFSIKEARKKSCFV